MADEHPNTEALERFLRGKVSKPERDEIVTHLISGCETCQEVTRAVWSQSGGLRGSTDPANRPRIHPSSYSGLCSRAREVGRLHEELLDADRHRARRLCRELIDLPGRERLPLVCHDDRFRSLHLVTLLIEEGLWRRVGSPPEAVDLMEVALAVAERLDVRIFGETPVLDLKAAAWSALGTAHRRSGDLDSAERALCIAEALLREGSGDPLERARLLLFKAALRRDQHRLDEALALLRRAEAYHGGLGDEPLLGHIRIERGRVEAHQGHLELAVESLHQGVRSLDPDRDQRVIFDTQVDLGHRLLDLGRTSAAMKALRAARASTPDTQRARSQQIEIDRLAGRVALARGDFVQAETVLRRLRSDCLGLDTGNDVLRVTLDLAAVFLAQDPEKLRRFGREMRDEIYPGMDLVAFASLDFLRAAADEPERHGGLISELAHQMERARPTAW